MEESQYPGYIVYLCLSVDLVNLILLCIFKLFILGNKIHELLEIQQTKIFSDREELGWAL